MGLKKKLPMGKPYEVAFRAAARGMKRLRGTPFDVFGWDPDRRTERAVIEEYERLRRRQPRPVRRPCRTTSLVGIAESPMAIKGYGPIKEPRSPSWRARVAELPASRVARSRTAG